MTNWYIVQTFSGFEQKVAETLKDNIKKKEAVDKTALTQSILRVIIKIFN